MRTSPTCLAKTIVERASGNNAAAVVTIAADAEQVWVVDSIYFGFTADPAAAVLLTVAIGGSTVFQIPITKGGAGVIPFRTADDEGLYGAKNQAVVVTLEASGTGGTIGYLNVKYR